MIQVEGVLGVRPKCAIKGEPDFHHMNYEKLKVCQNIVNDLIHVYTGGEDKEAVELLNKIWKDVSKAIADDVSNMPMKYLEDKKGVSEDTAPVKTLGPKLIRKSPLKVKKK